MVLLYLTKKGLYEITLIRNYENLRKILPSTFIYEPILIKKKSMNANIKKTQIFNKMKYDLRVYKRSQKVILKFQNHFFLR